KILTEEVEEQVFYSDGVLQSVEDALELANNDERLFLDIFARGYNEYSYEQEANRDEFHEILKDMNLNEEQVGVFKKLSKQIAKALDLESSEAAEMVKSKMSTQAA